MDLQNKIKFLLIILIIDTTNYAFAQGGWTVCNSPSATQRIDDLFMVNMQTGYAVSGNVVLKTIDEGNNWFPLTYDKDLYCRSVEFINAQKGFVGGFPMPVPIGKSAN